MSRLLEESKAAVRFQCNRKLGTWQSISGRGLRAKGGVVAGGCSASQAA